LCDAESGEERRGGRTREVKGKKKQHRRTEIVVTVKYHLPIFKWSIKLLIEMV